MIEADSTFGTFEILCDFCEESETFDTDGNFQVFIDEAKDRGWTMEKDGDEWTHRCPIHSEEFL